MTYKPTTDDMQTAAGLAGWSTDEWREWYYTMRAEVRAQALREAADKIHVSLPRAHKRDGRPLDPMFSLHDQGLWDGYKNAENWLRARADRIEQGGQP